MPCVDLRCVRLSAHRLLRASARWSVTRLVAVTPVFFMLRGGALCGIVSLWQRLRYLMVSAASVELQPRQCRSTS